MTDEEVNAIEDKLRQAQKLIEEAGQAVCSVRGKYAPELWNKLTMMSNDIGELIHSAWKLRLSENSGMTNRESYSLIP